jgi:hypothetical protein
MNVRDKEVVLRRMRDTAGFKGALRCGWSTVLVKWLRFTPKTLVLKGILKGAL